MYSGSNQFGITALSFNPVQQQQPGNHRGDAGEEQLPIRQRDQLEEGLAPQVREQKRQQTFNHQHHRQTEQPVIQHYLPPLPELFKYLKNAELGSSTITSLLFLKLCL